MVEARSRDGRGLDDLVVVAVGCGSTSMGPSGAREGGREGAGVRDGRRGMSTNTRSYSVSRP